MLGGAGGITGLMGGLGGAGSVAGGAFGALAPGVASTIAPAAASQLAGTIGASVAPGAFGANLAGAAAPGLTGSAAQTIGLEALKGKVIGAGVQNAAAQQATNLAFQNAAAQNMAGGLASKIAPQMAGYNPATAEALSAKFLANSPPLAKPFAGETLLADTSNKILPQSLANAQGQIGGTVSTPWGGVQSYQYGNFPAGSPLHAGTPTVTNTAAPTELLTTPSRFSEAGFRGLNPNYQSLLKPGANTVSETGQILADPRSEILGRSIRPDQNFFQNLGNISSFQDVKDYANQHPYATAGIAGLGAMGIKKLFEQPSVKQPESNAMIRPYTYDRSQRPEAYAVSPTEDSSERLYFNDQFIAGEPYKAAGGGIVSLAVGGPVEQMAAMNAVGANTSYPQANLQTPMYSNPAMQRPEATNVIAPSADAGVGAYTGEARFMAGGITSAQTRGSLPAKTSGGYKYSYDPTTMQFTQTGRPQPVATGRNSTPYSETRSITNWNEGNSSNRAPVATSMPANGTMTGGMMRPAMGPTEMELPDDSTNIPAYRTPEQQLGLGGFYGDMNSQLGMMGYAAGGMTDGHLGGYSDGGRLLKGPGDGVSDSIPASIGGRQPARLADGEFVVPARIVSELGNGSTEAGARKLYAMMERIQKGRSKSVGKGKVAVNSKADKYLPA
jgi:hypothetical protein